MTKARRVLVVALVGLLLMGISGCGDDAAQQGERPVADAQPPEPPPWPELAKEQHEEAERRGIPVRFENDLGMRFVLIPAGTFQMGSPEDEVGRDDDELQHQVTLTKSFYMQITEVTNGQFRRYEPIHDSGEWYVTFNEDQQPVVQVTREEYGAFADWLSGQDERRSYRLPTEAEWEYACRAGTRGRFWWGDSEDDVARCGNGAGTETNRNLGYALRDERFAVDDGHPVTAPVGSYLPNPWGLYDMLGNASERCSDAAGKYPAGPVVDPWLNPIRRNRPEDDWGRWIRTRDGSGWTATRVVLRGGSFRLGPSRLRSAVRLGADQFTHSRCDVGFRLVSPLPEEGD